MKARDGSWTPPPADGGHRPRARIALAIGDAAGISPELAARVLGDPDVLDAAGIVVIGDARVLSAGARVAGVELAIETVTGEGSLEDSGMRPVLIDLHNCDPVDIVPGQISEASGRFATENFRRALLMAAAGQVDGVCFTPFNKAAIPLSAVAGLLSVEAIVENLRLTDTAMRAAGYAEPRIAVAALNPHAGDNGNFGREEIDVISPAVTAAKAAGIGCDGPYPADTVFVRARRGDFDAVLTMYHDQGQIAMKLIGFDAGVTLMGGFPFPICTAAHGTAYDIAGKGVAHPGAMKNAMLLAARMAERARN
jgi:4-hydroxythreonine-4-phosphate dehydrogenase